MTFKFSFLEAGVPAKAANSLTASPDSPPVSKLAALAGAPSSNADLEPALGLVCWDAEAVGTLERRHQRFSDLQLADAEQLAQRLAYRDFDGDERTLCVECRYYRSHGCAVRGAWLPRMLQRCERFMPSIERAWEAGRDAHAA